MLYLPAGVDHLTHSTERTSLHLTLGIMCVTARTIIERALARAPGLDTRAPVGYRSGNPEHLRQFVAHDIETAVDHLQGCDIDAITRSERRRRLSAPQATGRLTTLLDTDTIDLDTITCWRATGSIVRMNGNDHPQRIPLADLDPSSPTRSAGRNGTSMQLETGTTALSMPIAMLETLCQLERMRFVRVRHLAGLDDRSRLVVEGVCQVASSTARAGQAGDP